MNKFLHSRYFLLAVIFTELLILFSAVYPFFVPRQNISYPYQTLTAQKGMILEDFHGGGYYIDDSTDYFGGFVSSPVMTLKRGSYDVTINYETNSSAQHYSIFSKYGDPSVTEAHQTVYLSSSSTQKSFPLNPSSDVEGFYIKLFYANDGYFLVNSIEILETNEWKRASLASAIFLLLFINLVYIAYRKQLWQKASPSARLVLAGLAVIILLPSIPLAMPYSIGGNDIKFHLLRIEELKNSLIRMQFPVRIQGGWLNNAGYAVSVFYADLFLYFPAFLRLCGFSVSFSYNSYIFAVNVLTALLAWYSFREVFKSDRLGLFGSLLYTIAPYRLTNIYMRAAVGEYTAYAFFPLILLGLYRIFMKDTADKDYKYCWILPALGYSGLIQSHVLSCEIGGFFTILTCLSLIRRTLQPKRFIELLKTLISTIVLNLGFLLPFLDYMRGDYRFNAGGAEAMIQTYGVFPSQLFNMFPESFGSSPNVHTRLSGADFLPTTIGIHLLFVLLLFLFLTAWKKPDRSDRDWKLAKWSTALGLLCMWMTTCYFPWDSLYKLGGFATLLVKSLQFPWRLVGMTNLFLILAGGALLLYIKRQFCENIYRVTGAVVSACALLSMFWFTGSLLSSCTFHSFNSQTLDNSAISNGEYIPAGTDVESLLTASYPIASPAVTVASYEHTAGNVRMDCVNSSDSESAVETGLLYYPYYRAVNTATGGTLPVSMGENGVVRITLPGGYNGGIHIFYREPILWRISELVSLFMILIILYFIIRNYRQTGAGKAFNSRHGQI